MVPPAQLSMQEEAGARLGSEEMSCMLACSVWGRKLSVKKAGRGEMRQRGGRAYGDKVEQLIQDLLHESHLGVDGGAEVVGRWVGPEVDLPGPLGLERSRQWRKAEHLHKITDHAPYLTSA